MIVAEHTDALSVPADATLNLRIGPVVDPSPSHSGTAAVPHVLGRFRVLDQIARGGMGIVLRAYDADLDRELAIKLLSPDIAPDSEAGRQFAREARVAGQLDHPGILPVYEAGCLPDGRAYFAMPFVRGRTLAALLAERPDRRHGLDHWLRVFDQVCAAVAYAHGRGVVHRDLKPANVMLGPHGQVVVMDWGVAAVRATGSRWGDDAQGYWVFGTPAYMPPEQARGSAEADPRADVFGLGGILCEILTGEPPYVGGDAAAVTRQAAAGDQVDLQARLAISGADTRLLTIVRSCLSPEPAERPADACEVARLVGEYLTAHECHTHRGQDRGHGSLRVAGLLTAAAALTAAALAGATARDLHARGRPDASPPARGAVTPTGSPPPTAPACPPSAASWSSRP